MKKAIVTIAIGELYTDIAKVTHPTIKAYADKIGADFIVWTNAGKHSIPHFRKLDIGSLFKNYDRVAYIDTDVVIRPDAPDIFQAVPPEKIGVFEEGRFAERAQNFAKYLMSYQINPATWDERYFNTGVMVFSKCHYLLFMQPPEEIDNFYEQSHINMMFVLLKPNLHELHYKFNRMHLMDLPTGEQRHDAWFIHYAGFGAAWKKEDIIGMMKFDVNLWRELAPEYKFRKNIQIEVEGGLGDQLCAEPVIRRIRDHVYKGDNVVIRTDFPDAFDHIGLPVFKKDQQPTPQANYFKLYTMREPGHPSWNSMSHALCHGVDFAAMQCLRGPLASGDKTIQQKFEFESVVKVLELCSGVQLEKLVLLHPGRGWPSKTLPGEFWNKLCYKLNGAGFPVAFIGKEISKEQGVAEGLGITEKEGLVYNLINKLDYKDCLALIANAPVLISNDSAPIHMAGAFDNHIGVIATCKHPEFILPYRNGSVWHKSKALEKKKMYEVFNNSPAQIEGATIDYIPEGKIEDYLPEMETVVEWVQSCFEKPLQLLDGSLGQETHNDCVN